MVRQLRVQREELRRQRLLGQLEPDLVDVTMSERDDVCRLHDFEEGGDQLTQARSVNFESFVGRQNVESEHARPQEDASLPVGVPHPCRVHHRLQRGQRRFPWAERELGSDLPPLLAYRIPWRNWVRAAQFSSAPVGSRSLRRLDQQAGDPAAEAGGYSVISNENCLILIDRFRPRRRRMLLSLLQHSSIGFKSGL